MPVCFALLDRTDGEAPSVATPLDEKPKDAAPRQLRRVRDVRANPRVALVVDRYDEDWDRLAWVQVRGTARLVEPGEEGHGRAIAALRAKYDQYADHALGERPLLLVDPGHVVSWGAVETGDE